MDVSLILTHRCNLACGYCYAGEHHKSDIDDEVLRRAVELLYSDGASRAQLSFFGGEPFLAFDAMRRATALAEERARREGGTLSLQCTTNGSVLKPEHVRFVRDHGMHVTVSIDGIREAHELNRPCGGGKPSFDQVRGGLRALIKAGVPCDAMMVITPETAQYAYLSANFLWSEGVTTVRANLDLTAKWSDLERAELREQLESIGWEMLARRLRGEDTSFKPFERGMRQPDPSRPNQKRNKVVVATTGNLYPCAPMVGEDRNDGREAALRLGHIDDGAPTIQLSVASEGVACESGRGCECAAYLETGDRTTLGRMGRWYGLVCQEMGASLRESLAQHQDMPPPRRKRRGFLIGLAAVVGGAAVGGPLLAGLLADDPAPRPCQLRTRKQNAPVPEDLPVPGEMPMVLEPEPVIEPEPMVDGEMPVEMEMLGDVSY